MKTDRLWLLKSPLEKRLLFKNFKLIMALDDFYSEIKRRDSKIDEIIKKEQINEIDKKELIKINNKCIGLSTYVLNLLNKKV